MVSPEPPRAANDQALSGTDNICEKGSHQDEIDEAAWMGVSFAGSPAMVFYEQLKND